MFVVFFKYKGNYYVFVFYYPTVKIPPPPQRPMNINCLEIGLFSKHYNMLMYDSESAVCHFPRCTFLMLLRVVNDGKSPISKPFTVANRNFSRALLLVNISWPYLLLWLLLFSLFHISMCFKLLTDFVLAVVDNVSSLTVPWCIYRKLQSI